MPEKQKNSPSEGELGNNGCVDKNCLTQLLADSTSNVKSRARE